MNAFEFLDFVMLAWVILTQYQRVRDGRTDMWRATKQRFCVYVGGDERRTDVAVQSLLYSLWGHEKT